MKNDKFKAILVFITALAVTTIAVNYFIGAALREHFSKGNDIFLATGVFKDKLKTITPENLKNIKELFILPHETGRIIALAEDSDAKTLNAIYENGDFIKWDLASGTLLTNKIFFVGLLKREPGPPIHVINSSVSFSNNGTFVITPNQITSKGIYGLNLWNTDTLEQIKCMGDEQYCPGWGPSDDTFLSLLLHPTRDIYFTSGKGSVLYGVYGFTNEKNGSFILKNEHYGDPIITRLSIDSTGSFLAFSDETGKVQVGDVSNHKTPISNEQYYGFSETAYYNSSSRKTINTIDLKFDDTLSWLGRLTDNDITVWDLKNYIVPFYLNIKIKNGNAICFDRTGKLLAIASNDGVTFFDLEKKMMITELPVEEVSALFFSKDNRLLIWGDSVGAMHFWGIP